MNKLVNGILNARWIILGISLVLTLFFAFQIKNLSINADIVSSLPDKDPIANLYKEIGTEFGGNDLAMIVLESENIFNPSSIRTIQMLTDSIRFTTGISTVTSLTNIIDIKSSEWGIEIGNLVDPYELPQTAEEISELREKVMQDDLYKGSIISEDGSSAIILFSFLPDADKPQITRDIKSLTERMNLSERVYFGGVPVMMNDVNDLILADIIWLIPIVFILISLILLLSFRAIKAVILPLLVAGIAVIWTMGLMSVLNYELTIISNVIPVVLLAIGSAYTIHVLNSVAIHKETKDTNSLSKALIFIIIPVILAAITTSIGFISFVFGSYLTMIRDFGIFTAIGVLFALLLSILLVPAILSLLPHSDKFKGTRTKQNEDFLATKVLLPLIQILFKHPVYISISWLIILAFAAIGFSSLETSVNIANYFKKDNATRISEEILQSKFGGSAPVFVVFEGDMQDPEVLQLMKNTSDYMKEDPLVDMAQSVADLIEQMNDAMGEGLSIPKERAKIEQLWFLLDGQDIMDQLVNDDLSKGVIQSKFASAESKEIEVFQTRMLKFIEQNQSDYCKISLTGMPSVYLKLNTSLVNSQYSSLLIAVLLVLIIVGFIFRSLRQGIYATIPVIATILLLFGFMGASGIHLDIATVLVGSIALGIGIDYSIHVISGYNTYRKESNNSTLAIEKTILTSGKAVIINILSVASGFLVLLFSQLVPLQHFGLLVAISMIGSGLGSLTLLPVILILIDRRKTSKQKMNS